MSLSNHVGRQSLSRCHGEPVEPCCPHMNHKPKLAGLVAVALVIASATFGIAALSQTATQTTIARAIPGVTGDEDPFVWLEQKDGPKALAWVRTQNARTLAIL